MPRLITLSLMLLWASAPVPSQIARPLHFAILGDRTGETQAGVYEKVLRAATSGQPAFVVTAGDTIQGLQDATAEAEWQQWEQLVQPFRRFALYLVPGNHDIWSDASESLFRKHSGRPLHYSFDAGPVHVTVLDNSRTEELPAAELEFLEQDLQAHAAQPVKFVISHRPSWILHVLTRNTDFPLHRLARKYGVQYVVAGHVHQMLHFSLEGVEYVSMVSAGGHLRASGRYEDGWFFGYADVAVDGRTVSVRIHELNGRVTALSAWGPAGLAPLVPEK